MRQWLPTQSCSVAMGGAGAAAGHGGVGAAAGHRWGRGAALLVAQVRQTRPRVGVCAHLQFGQTKTGQLLCWS